MYTLLTPWPTQRNGIADYSYEIARHGSSPIRLVTEALQPKRLGDKVAVTDADAFLREPSARKVYHFGNNPDHAFLVPLFLREPGIAVIHDASLHYLAQKTEPLIPGFFEHMVANDGNADVDLVMRCWRANLKLALDFAEVKCLSWLKNAKAIVVHSRYARRMVGSRLPGIPIHVIPHFAYLGTGKNHNEARAQARRALSIDDGAYVITTIGFVTRNKQYDSVMKAIASLPLAKRQKVTYIVAGEVRPEEYDIAKDIEKLGATFVRLMDYVSAETIDHLLYGSDLIFNLRYPTYGESSGSVARAQGVGAVLVTSSAGSFGEIPPETCFHVPSALDVTAEVAAIIEQCMDDPSLLDRKREAALAYAHGVLAPTACARAYEEVIYAD